MEVFMAQSATTPEELAALQEKGTEQTARHALSETDWAAIERDPAFQNLIQRKRGFILPATIFFIAYYFALPVLVGYFPDFMDTKVIGYINLAYLFALSQFFMAWILMAMYVKRAGVFDVLASRIAAKVKGGSL
jgi:uncharacterized membrane protein (DUF485 family)